VGGAQVFTWGAGMGASGPSVIDVEGADVTEERRPKLPRDE
jgi:hypothetical protein